MSIEIVGDWSRVAPLREGWNRLLRGSAPEHVFLTFEWFDAIREAHGRGQALWTMVATGSNGPETIWPLHLRRHRVGGVLPWRTVSDGGGWYVPHNGIATRREPRAAVRELLDCLRARRGWDQLSVNSLVADGAWHRAFVEEGARLGLPVVAEPAHRSPFLPLDGGWDEYLAACKSKFRSDLKRCRRSLEKLGAVEHRRHAAPEEVPAAYRTVLEIEKHSWKHAAGSAITSRDWEATFYERLIAGAAPRGWIQISLTLVDGRPIAYDLGVVHGDRYACLKTSFIEQFRSTNPGKVLRQFVVEGLFERGLGEHDFLGEDEPWKTQWTGRLRPHVNLTIYRGRFRAALVSSLRRLRRRGGGEVEAP